MLSLIVTAIALPAFAELNVPACVKLTLARSPAITPDKVPPVTVATLLPLYTLSVIVVPVTVSTFAVMFADKLAGWVTR